jgi:hypothetical protein
MSQRSRRRRRTRRRQQDQERRRAQALSTSLARQQMLWQRAHPQEVPRQVLGYGEIPGLLRLPFLLAGTVLPPLLFSFEQQAGGGFGFSWFAMALALFLVPYLLPVEQDESDEEAPRGTLLASLRIPALLAFLFAGWFMTWHGLHWVGLPQLTSEGARGFGGLALTGAILFHHFRAALAERLEGLQIVGIRGWHQIQHLLGQASGKEVQILLPGGAWERSFSETDALSEGESVSTTDPGIVLLRAATDSQQDRLEVLCEYCSTGFSNPPGWVVCTRCHTPHHADCWDEGRGCTTYGCGGTQAHPSKTPEQVPTR